MESTHKIIVENEATRQTGFAGPVAFTPEAWSELVAVDADTYRTDERLLDLLRSARHAILAGTRAVGVSRTTIEVKYEKSVGAGPREMSVYLLIIHRDDDGNLSPLIGLIGHR